LGGGGAPGGGHVNGVELVSLRVTLGPKVLFLALRENDRGRFLKLSNNAGAHSARAKIIMAESGIAELREAIATVARRDRELDNIDAGATGDGGGDGAGDNFNDHDDNVPPAPRATSATAAAARGTSAGQSAAPATVPLVSERLYVRGRRFFLDVLANDRGRYCKLSAVEPHGRRASVIFPASGLDAVVEAIDEIVAQAPPLSAAAGRRLTGEASANGAHNDPGAVTTGTRQMTKHEIHVDGKRVVVESGSNRRGSFVRVQDNYNGAVTLPFSALSELIGALQQIQEAGDPADVGDMSTNGNAGSTSDVKFEADAS
jgi:PurA ssDNA and RNA-binding protein